MLSLFHIAVAGEDWEAGILGKARVGKREFAENKKGTAVGFDAAGVCAVGAKTDRFSRGGEIFSLFHGTTVSQHNIKELAKTILNSMPGTGILPAPAKKLAVRR